MASPLFLDLLRLLLAAVFFGAGMTKLVHPAPFRAGLEGFGIPLRWQQPVGTFVPWIEVAAGALLVASSTVWWGAAVAMACLAAFTGQMGWLLSRGRRPDCNCFGASAGRPIGPRDLLRNALLIGAAGLILLQGPDHAHRSVMAALRWLADRSDATELEWLAFLGLGTLFSLVAWWHIQRNRPPMRHGEPRDRQQAIDMLSGAAMTPLPMASDGPPPDRPAASGPSTTPMAAVAPQGPHGAGGHHSPHALHRGIAAPEFTLRSLDGPVMSRRQLGAAGRPLLLIFIDPACSTCSQLLPYVAQWQQSHADRMTVALVSRGDDDANRAKIGRLGVRPVLLQDDREVALAYHALRTPSAVRIDGHGRVDSSVVEGGAAILALADQTLEAMARTPARLAL